MEVSLFKPLSWLWLSKEERVPVSQTDLCLQSLGIHTLGTLNQDRIQKDFVIHRSSHRVYSLMRSNSTDQIDQVLGKVCLKVGLLLPLKLILGVGVCLIKPLYLYLPPLFKRDSFKLAIAGLVFHLLSGLWEAIKRIYYAVGIGLCAIDGILFNPVRAFFYIGRMEKKYLISHETNVRSEMDEAFIDHGLLSDFVDFRHFKGKEIQKFSVINQPQSLREREPHQLFPFAAKFIDFSREIKKKTQS